MNDIVVSPADRCRPRDRSAVPLDEVVARVSALYKQEQKLLREAGVKQKDAMVLAFRIGEAIHNLPRAYGSGAVAAFAKACRFSAPTAYDYLHLYRGCLLEGNVHHLAHLDRDYFQCLGRLINGFFPDKRGADGHDLLDMYVHGLLLLYPLLAKEHGRPPVPDLQALTEASKLLRHFHKLVKKSPPFSQVLADCRLEQPNNNNELYLFTLPTGSEPAQKEAAALFIDEFQRLLHNIFAVGKARLQMKKTSGSSLPRLKLFQRKAGYKPGAMEIIFHDDRDRLINPMFALPAPDEPLAKAKVVHGRSDLLLKDNAILPARSVDVVLTDPPYSPEIYKFNYEPWHKVDHDSPATAEDAAQLVGRVAKLLVDNAIIKEQFIWFSFFPTDFAHVFVPHILDAFSGKGLDVIHQVLSWEKGTGIKGGGHRHFRRDVENVLYINVGNRPLSPKISGARCDPSTLLTFPTREKGAERRGYWKPLALLEHLIRLATYNTGRKEDAAQLILDPFGGSGSTAVAAINCQRDFRIIESHAGQFALARRNVADALQNHSR